VIKGYQLLMLGDKDRKPHELNKTVEIHLIASTWSGIGSVSSDVSNTNRRV
jgi:hypothetical protein